MHPRPLWERAIFSLSRSLRKLENRVRGIATSVRFCTPHQEFLKLVPRFEILSSPTRGEEFSTIVSRNDAVANIFGIIKSKTKQGEKL